MKRQIIIWPDPILSRPVPPTKIAITEDVKRLLADMEEAMLAAKGAGLAAPQLGYPLPLVVLLAEQKDIGKEGEKTVIKLVNPEIVERQGEQTGGEGCLSFPGTAVKVVGRAKWVKVKALDENGNPIEVEGDGLLALALQHEIDHLDGKLISDRLGPVARDMLKAKYVKMKKRGLRYNFDRPEPKDFTQPPPAV